jgi:hypothetical protein
MTVRAKSIENKRRRLLAESIRFQKRIEIMRKRRAQFFAPGVKMLNIDRDAHVKQFDEYVMRKRKIKVDPELIVEQNVKKRVLYRNASTEALLRLKDVVAFEQQQPLGSQKKVKANVDLRSAKSRDGSF